MTESKALEILKKYTTKPNLIKHAKAVAACMSHFAKQVGENQEYWAVVGLLHDIDYELCGCTADGHCVKCVDILKTEGFDDKFIHAVQSHGNEIVNDIAPTCYMEQVLSAVDQASGFVIACAMMKPGKTLAEVDLVSMKKRWKDKKFAAGTGRERIERVAERMGKDLDWLLCETLAALKTISDELGL